MDPPAAACVNSAALSRAVSCYFTASAAVLTDTPRSASTSRSAAAGPTSASTSTGAHPAAAPSTSNGPGTSPSPAAGGLLVPRPPPAAPTVTGAGAVTGALLGMVTAPGSAVHALPTSSGSYAPAPVPAPSAPIVGPAAVTLPPGVDHVSCWLEEGGGGRPVDDGGGVEKLGEAEWRAVCGSPSRARLTKRNLSSLGVLAVPRLDEMCLLSCRHRPLCDSSTPTYGLLSPSSPPAPTSS